MSEKFEDIVVTAAESQQQSYELMGQLVAVARPGAVYSEPVTSGDYTVITASEVSVGMGFGYGIGGGTSSEASESEAADSEEPDLQGEEASGIGGGGGLSLGRPVAVISVGPSGVQVEPVRDVTKVLLALITAVGAMLIMLGRMSKLSRG